MLFCIKTSFLAKKRFIEYKDTRTSLKSFHLLPPQKAHCATKIEITQLLDFIRDLGFFVFKTQYLYIKLRLFCIEPE